ncbi:MAG TPA: antitoxin Xre/MbcA/ParS toxin-binding domain-containing protein [Vicinamibacterales bacterium]|nr:antitoxin Xre/MbcA/ParS toxin-binding domain-containing protein [Vicinamibacterales bacterium]
MASDDYIGEVLGGASVAREQGAAALRDRVRRGLPYRSFDAVRTRLQLSVPEAAAILHMPPRTLARRRQARRLDPLESDRLYRLARVAAYAFTALGSEPKGAAWLRRPNRALGGEAPLALLDTDAGARQVEALLGRLEHGIPG